VQGDETSGKEKAAVRQRGQKCMKIIIGGGGREKGELFRNAFNLGGHQKKSVSLSASDYYLTDRPWLWGSLANRML